MSPCLVLGTETFQLREGEALVGSGAQANFRVLNRDLMARHFLVRVFDGTATLVPASEDAVVAVEGDQVLQDGRELADGDLVTAGSACFFFWSGAPRSVVQERPPAPPAYLLVADQWGMAHPLTRTSTAIGRDPTNVVVVRDPTASRFHAEIRREAGGYALHAMGSTGTRLNGRELDAPRLLHEGDVIEIAFASFRFTEQPVPAGVAISAEPLAVGSAITKTVTGQSRRASLPAVAPGKEPPRNVGLLVGTTAVIVAMVAALFWLLR